MSGRRKTLAIAISLLATVALGVSAYLTWVTWQSGTVAGCTADSLLDCDEVLTSRWSKWFGLPVSLLGGLTYVAILGLCWPAASRPRGTATTALFALALIAAGAGVWFIGLQAIQVQSYCIYCLTVHACGLLIGVLALLMFLDSSGASDYDQMRSLLGVAAADAKVEHAEEASSVSGGQLLAALGVSAIGLSLLMGGQLLSEPADTMEVIDLQALASESEDVQATDDANTIDDLIEDEAGDQGTFEVLAEPSSDDNDWLDQVSEGSSQGDAFPNEPPQTIGSLLGADTRRLKFDALAEPVDVTSMPIIGSPKAEHVMVKMMDYTCTHCRHLHPHIRAAIERYDGQLSVIIHHVPLSKKCNPNVRKDHPGKKYACDYAQLALGIWNLAPRKFPEFHDWLLESEKPPNIAKARARALKLAGSAIFDKKSKAEIGKVLNKQAADLQRLKVGLPVVLFQNGALRGVPEDSEKLFEYLESTLGVEPR